MKRRNLYLALFMLFFATHAVALTSATVKSFEVPVLLDRTDNPIYYLRLEAGNTECLTKLKLEFDESLDMKYVKSVKLFYSGTETAQRLHEVHYTPLKFPLSYIPRNIPGRARSADASYSILLDCVKSPAHVVEFSCNKQLFGGVNYLWISLEMKKNTPLTTTVLSQVTTIEVDSKSIRFDTLDRLAKGHKLGIGVRQAGDDDVIAYRIPGMVTSSEGTLLGVYDIRYNGSVDAQEYIEIGLSRSTDKGNTWEKMKSIIAFGEDGGMPMAQNGVCDPSILVDEKTGTIWVAALWTYGMGNGRAFGNSMQGMDKDKTGQLVLVKSEDDGKTWSKPINITEQVKDPSWYLLFQGPGRGITMQDGTLVFPIQYIDKNKIPNAGIMYSKDGGENWTIHTHAHTNTTESQVVELAPGELMLNMRDNRKGSRAIYITKDMGRTWTPHSSNRSALIESVCMASLIKVEADENVLGKDILFFSNPNTTSGRHSMTIKASVDDGKTWNEHNQLLLDEEKCWGYSCLTLVDEETIGILYEGSQAQMLFQQIKITDIVQQ